MRLYAGYPPCTAIPFRCRNSALLWLESVLRHQLLRLAILAPPAGVVGTMLTVDMVVVAVVMVIVIGDNDGAGGGGVDEVFSRSNLSAIVPDVCGL